MHCGGSLPQSPMHWLAHVNVGEHPPSIPTQTVLDQCRLRQENSPGTR